MLSEAGLRRYFAKRGYKLGKIRKTPDGWSVQAVPEAQRLFATLLASRQNYVEFTDLPEGRLRRLVRKVRVLLRW